MAMSLDEFLEEWNNPSPYVHVQTSGSTGTPKPMLVEKQRMLNSARITCDFLGLREGDTALLCMSLDYIAGKMMVVRSIERGLKLISVEPSGHPLATVPVVRQAHQPCTVPEPAEGSAIGSAAGFEKALHYMGFTPGQSLLGTKVDYVFLGACTNGRIEDFRAFASIVKGRQKAADVIAWLVPGSWAVDKQIREEGLDKILEAAGFEIRQPGCSACLAMNDDKIPAGKLSVSTSNRNFEGRQGPGARTILASPLTAAAAAVTGKITDPRELL